MQQEMADIEAQTNKLHSCDQSAIIKKDDRPVILKFKDVVYKIKTRNGYKSKPEEKYILKGVTGIVLPGEMLAMLGPSGSGKTTLLTLLGGRIDPASITGSITYNSSPFSSMIKRNTGFVTQDDVLFEHLTVSETLIFTSLLRLPNSFSKQEKIAKAEEVMEDLGLTKCRNSIIGGPMVRGISGGERKRVSIGQEMLINPSLLFLDEPTSGLDSSTAQKIVSMLWDFANHGKRTIVLTIHQPSSLLFYMFHKILLLSEGSPLYFGKAGEAMDHFSSIGFTPSVAMNPSDFLLDLANGISEGVKNDQDEVKQTLICSYKVTLEESLKTEVEDYDMQHIGSTVAERRWCTTWWQQFWVLLQRGMKERKYESFAGMKIIQVFIVALLCGFLWWHSDLSHIQDQIGLLFFCSGFWGFFPLFQAIFTFPQERMVLEKERASGMYRLSSYFMARTIGDLPMELALPTAFTIITYWMSGLKPTAVNFGSTMAVLLYAVLVAHGMGLGIGALVMDQKSATTLASVLMLSFLLASGYYVQHIPPFISWIKYFSITHYSFKLFLEAQYSAHESYPCGPNGALCSVEDVPAIKLVGLDGWGVPVLALLIMLIGYRVIAYVALMRVGLARN